MLFFPNHGKADDYFESGFGWETFTLASSEAKMTYLGTQIMHALRETGADYELARLIVHDLTGHELDVEREIDHQSVWNLPRNFHSRMIDVTFLRDWAEFLNKPEILILGGNDNGDSHPLEKQSGATQFVYPFVDDRYGLLTCRKDPQGFWTLFNKTTGAKIRFTFDRVTHLSPDLESFYYQDENGTFIPDRYGHLTSSDPRAQVDPTYKTPLRGYAPELVDMELTQYCDIGCTFCYRGSTEKGEHADYVKVIDLLDMLSQLKVFEVAFGGGEPTMHPRFLDILSYASRVGIVPNFTTKNMKWLKSPDFVEAMKYAGAFAFSVMSKREIDRVLSVLDYHQIDSHRVNFHIVMGSLEFHKFKELVGYAAEKKVRVTLLGWKYTERGLEQKPMDYSGWLPFIKALVVSKHNFRVSIDTVLAQEFDQELQDAGVPTWSYHTHDGRFSAYIDAVEYKFGPSSYAPREQLVEIPRLPYWTDRFKFRPSELAEWFVETYRGFSPRG
jgi:hypothetical protein